MASSASVSTSWQRSAGDFTCIICQRKRLPASEFSKAQVKAALNRGSNNRDMRAKCKVCVEQEANAERQAAAEKRKKKSEEVNSGEQEMLKCTKCLKTLSINSYSRSQAEKIKHNKKGKCKNCVLENEAAEQRATAAKRDGNIKDLKEKAKLKGAAGTAARLKLACLETAAQAEAVTGITSTSSSSAKKR